MFNYRFQWRQAWARLPEMLDAALVTMQIAVLSMLIGILLAVMLTMFRRSGSRILSGFATTWVEIARNTPALFQIYMAHFGMAGLGIYINPYNSLLFGIAFNNAGYLAENFRGALKAIPETQTRAGRSLGMSDLQAFRLIVLPQMIRIAFPTITNQMVWAVLMTSLGVTVSMASDLYGVTQAINAVNFRTFELFSMAAVIFYLIVKVIQAGAWLISRRLFRY
ncbi:MAG: amino acid ABC transporter permease [Paracoccus sp. (in: a-proteobacteria)]|nr:amino acid ABC transporter permease [Paracoccus sp. (in: a-proteobacteria)]